MLLTQVKIIIYPFIDYANIFINNKDLLWKYLELYEKFNEKLSSKERIKKFLTKNNNLWLYTLKFSEVGIIEVIINFLIEKLSILQALEGENLLEKNICLNSFKQNPIHCLMFNNKLTFGSKLSIYSKISSIIKTNETAYWNSLDFWGNLPFNFLLSNYERILDNNNPEANQDKFKDLFTLALNNTNLSIFQNKREEKVYMPIQDYLKTNKYNHPFSSIFTNIKPDNLKFILNILKENKLVDVFAIDITSKKKEKEIFLEKIIKINNKNFLNIVVPFLLEQTFNDNPENYDYTTHYKGKRYNKYYTQNGFLILKFLSLPQVTNLSDTQIEIITKILKNEMRRANSYFSIKRKYLVDLVEDIDLSNGKLYGNYKPIISYIEEVSLGLREGKK